MTGIGPGMRWVELIPRGENDQPSFWWCAMRFMQGAEKMLRLQDLLHEIVDDWDATPEVRMRKDAEPNSKKIELAGSIGIIPDHKREASLLASELLFHVRTALDHTVYQSAWRDSGRRQQGTAFPLAKKRSDWAKRARSELKGMSADHRALIESTQPYNDISWTQNLALLSNRDKHRTAVEVTPTYRFRINLDRRFADPLGDPNYYGFHIEDPQIHCRLIPAEHDGGGGSHPEALDALGQIVVGAAEVLNAFLGEEGVSPIRVEAAGARPELNPRTWSGRQS